MKTIFISIAIIGMLASCSNQEIASGKVPSVVLNSVKEKFPSATGIDWEKKDNLYEAELDLNDSTDVSILVNDAGKWIMHKQDIPLSYIPAAILSTLQNQYKDHTIDDAERVEVEGAVYYQFDMEGNGTRDLKLVFTEAGTVENNRKYWE
jgi:hypothetical protein